jgi:chitin synthase
MTGVITSTTEKNKLITLLQDMEYIHGQLFERAVESGCGAVTCLPGALTILRFSAFRRMSKYYFADKAEQCEDLFDYGKCHLGEDRWLTHLFMIGAKERYQIQMNTGAFCKTEAVQTYATLLKQRRRWFLGFITNEVCMLTDIRLWKRYPILCVIRFAQNTIRTTALLFFIMVISLLTTSQRVQNLPVGFIGVSLGLNWLLMLYFGAKLGRYKIMLYPVMFVVNPFFNWCYMVYGIFTAGQRTWGGPRADAGKADAKTSPQEAIEQAEANGDDLNVVPETFKTSLSQRRKKGNPQTHVPLQPSDNMEGRFAQSQRLPGGWYQHANDSGMTLPDTMPRNHMVPRIPLHPRASYDSVASATTAHQSVYMPRRIESFMSPEDTRRYHSNQNQQRPAGGAYFEAEQAEETAELSNHEYKDSIESLVSGPSSPVQAMTPMTAGSSPRNSNSNSPGTHSPANGAAELPRSLTPGAGGTTTPGLAPPRAPGGADRFSTATVRSMSSPLARQSFMRSVDDITAIEMTDHGAARPPPAGAPPRGPPQGQR